MEPLVHNPAIQNALTDKITDRDHHPAQRDQLRRSGRGRAVEPRAAQSQHAAQVGGPRDRQRGRRVHSQRGPQDRDGPAVRPGLGPGQHPRPPGTGEGALRPGHQLGQRQERPGRRGPGPVHRRRQAGPGQARLQPRQQDPGDQPDVDAVLGQVPGQGAIGVPADQQPQDRAAGTDAAAAGPGRVRRPWPPPRADRRRARPRRVDAGARRRAVYLPRHLPEQRAKQRAARRRRCRLVRHARPIHQGGTAHGPGGGPGGRRRCVPGRAVGNCGPDPGGFRSRAGPGPPRRRARRRAHRPGGDVDLRAPQGAADLRRGPGRAGLRVLGRAPPPRSSSSSPSCCWWFSR